MKMNHSTILLLFLQNFMDDIEHDTLYGDLLELYQLKYQSEGKASAGLWLGLQILKALPSFILSIIMERLYMLHHVFKVALRNFLRQKLYSLIHVFNLALAMAASVLILFWVQHELSYDRFHKKGNELYRIVTEFKRFGQTWPVVSIPVAPALKSEYTDIINTTRCSPVGSLIQKGDTRFNESGAYVDPSFFKMFSFPSVEGNDITGFTNPNSIVITRETANKYFGQDEAVGQTLRLNNRQDFTVCGVIENIPKNSHIQYNFFLPFSLYLEKDRDPGHWARFQLFAYIELSKNISHLEVEKQISNIIIDHRPEAQAILHLEPLKRIHLYSSGGGGNIRYVRFFTVIAILILVIASINTMNLTTARAQTRLKEVAVRKVNGAGQNNLFFQFMGESFVVFIVATLLALCFILLFFTRFNMMSGMQLPSPFVSLNWIGLLFGMAVLMWTISTGYPAIQLASLKIPKTLRSTIQTLQWCSRGSFIRKTLVLLQFSISIFMIIATLVISRQLSYIQNKDLGFDRNQVLYFSMRGNMHQQIDALKNEIAKGRGIKNVSLTSELPTQIARSYNGLDWENRDPVQDVEMGLLSVDHDFIDAMNIKIISGRSFSNQYPTDTGKAYILNEQAVKIMKLESPVGKWFEWKERGQIIGIVKDFHFKSLNECIAPLIIVMDPDRYQYVCVNIQSSERDMSETIQHIESVWKQFSPDHPFKYHFLNDEFENMYKTEIVTSRIYRYFTFLALFISCLGLFGLVVFMAERRTKEIGIRKTLGSSETDIVYLMTKDYLKLITASNIIAWPLAYIIMRKWLYSYFYHTTLGLDIFLISGVCTIIIGLLPVLGLSIKSAKTNPASSLRYE
ncbi:ABC transporter permease [bacterium]|nr:ABC transporter permease [bacterium]